MNLRDTDILWGIHIKSRIQMKRFVPILNYEEIHYSRIFKDLKTKFVIIL